MIRTVRHLLLAVVKEKSFTDDSLHTLMINVEAMVNSRPLTEVCLEPGEKPPLTPNHLLRIDPEIGLPPNVVNERDCYARQRWKAVQYAADEF